MVNPTSPVSPLADYPPLPSPENRSRAPEFYGFVALTSTSLLYVVYLLWALLPDRYIQWSGVNWYPNREWAILLPAYSIVLVLLTYFVYFALAIYRTPSFDSLSTMIDSRAHYVDGNIGLNSSSGMYDIPIGLVNRVAYGSKKKNKDALGR